MQIYRPTAMCLGIPMQIRSIDGFVAHCEAKGVQRDVNLFIDGEMDEYSPMPDHYFSEFNAAVLREYESRVRQAVASNQPVPPFPEDLVIPQLRNTWQDTARVVIGNWIGLIYQYTNVDRRVPFMQGVDLENPLNLPSV